MRNWRINIRKECDSDSEGLERVYDKEAFVKIYWRRRIEADWENEGTWQEKKRGNRKLFRWVWKWGLPAMLERIRSIRWGNQYHKRRGVWVESSKSFLASDEPFIEPFRLWVRNIATRWAINYIFHWGLEQYRLKTL